MITSTVKVEAFTSPTARRRGSRPVRVSTHYVAEATTLPGGAVLDVLTACGRVVSVQGADQLTTVSYLEASERPATCGTCTKPRAAR